MITQGRKLVVEGLGSDDRYRYDETRQTLFIVCPNADLPNVVHRVAVSIYPPLTPAFELNNVWTDFGARIIAFTGLMLGLLAFWLLMVFSRA